MARFTVTNRTDLMTQVGVSVGDIGTVTSEGKDYEWMSGDQANLENWVLVDGSETRMFSGGLPIAVGFDMQSNRPLDEREIVNSIDDLKTMPNAYKHIEVTVNDSGMKFKWNGIDQTNLDNWKLTDVTAEAIENYLPLSGGTMYGDINLDDGILRRKGSTLLHNYSGNATDAANVWYHNVFLGEFAGNRTVGDGETALGVGMMNVGLGSYALNGLTTGQQNNMIGTEAGALLTTGQSNDGIGAGIFYFLRTGSDNTGMGKNVYQNMTLGSRNIGIGRNAGYYADGSNKLTDGGVGNILIGYEAAHSKQDPTKEIAIGYEARGQGDNTTTIGGADNTDVFLTGNAKVSGGGTYDHSVTINGADDTSLGTNKLLVKGGTGFTGADTEASLSARGFNVNIISPITGWSRYIGELSIDGVGSGGFGAYGNGTDFKYLFFGETYNTNNFKVDPKTGNVYFGLGTSGNLPSTTKKVVIDGDKRNQLLMKATGETLGDKIAGIFGGSDMSMEFGQDTTGSIGTKIQVRGDSYSVNGGLIQFINKSVVTTTINDTDAIFNVPVTAPNAAYSTTTGEPTGATRVGNTVYLTQAEYDAGTPVADTHYIIIE